MVNEELAGVALGARVPTTSAARRRNVKSQDVTPIANERRPRELFEDPRGQLVARLTKVRRHVGQYSGESSHTQRTVLRHGDMVFAVDRSSQPHVAAGLSRQLIPA